MSAQDNSRAFVFKAAKWAIRSNGALERNQERGTWHDLRMLGGRYGHIRNIALYACPACGELGRIVDGPYQINHLGRVKGPKGHVLECASYTCDFKRDSYFDRWNNKPLYAVALEAYTPRGYIPEIKHCHATTESEARREVAMHPLSRIIAIGPAIGHWRGGKHDFGVGLTKTGIV